MGFGGVTPHTERWVSQISWDLVTLRPIQKGGCPRFLVQVLVGLRITQKVFFIKPTNLFISYHCNKKILCE